MRISVFGSAVGQLLLPALLSVSLLWAMPAEAVAAGNRHAAMVVDGNNGVVLHSDQADEPRYPASLTKMMTLYLAFEAIERGRTSYNARVRISPEAAAAPPSKLDLDAGETIALGDAMKALVTKSANDIAVAVAEHLGGTETRFAQMMTEKARLFGMSRTTFRNASGLPDPGQTTTARDMITLALRLHDDFPKLYQLFAMRSFTYDGETYRNHNSLLHRFQGTDGIKTGYTRASGFNLVSSVRRGGRHVIGAVFGGSTASRRDDAMQLLLSRALMKASPYKTRRSAPVLVAAAQPVARPMRQPSLQATASSAPTPPPAHSVLQTPPAIVTERSRPIFAVADAGQSWPQQSPRGQAPVLAPALAPVPATIPAPVAAVRPHVTPQATAAAQAPQQQPQQHQRLAFAPRGFEPAATRPHSVAGVEVQPSPIPTPAKGTAPSTLQQQALTLSRGPEAQAGPLLRPVQPAVQPPPYAVRGPSSAALSGPSPSGGFEIQIGAYNTAAEADRALAAARAGTGDHLRGSVSRAIPAQKDARQFYRARFVGLDQRNAASACLELRRRQIDCFVMRAE